jgi:purine nucleosidase
MGGRFDGEGKEHNATCDPHATEIVFRARPPLHRSVGLDVTRQTSLSVDETRALLSGPRLGPVRDMAEVWFEGVPGMTLHDPLAAATLFELRLCSFAQGHVSVEEGGVTGWRGTEDGPHEVATSVDREAFLTHIRNTL